MLSASQVAKHVDIHILRSLNFFFFLPFLFPSMQFARLKLKLNPIIWKEIGKMAWNFQFLLQYGETILSSLWFVLFWSGFFLFFFGFFNLYLFWMSLIREEGNSTCVETASEMECIDFTQQSGSIASFDPGLFIDIH